MPGFCLSAEDKHSAGFNAVIIATFARALLSFIQCKGLGALHQQPRSHAKKIALALPAPWQKGLQRPEILFFQEWSHTNNTPRGLARFSQLTLHFVWS